MALKQNPPNYKKNHSMNFSWTSGSCSRRRTTLPAPIMRKKRAFEDLEAIGPDTFKAFLLDSIGHVKLKCVDVISCHFEFDERNNTIFLFRFPSILRCPLHGRARPRKVRQVQFTQLFLHASSSRQWAIEEAINQLLKGILTSYRLLFGQNKQARKFFLASVDLLLDF